MLIPKRILPLLQTPACLLSVVALLFTFPARAQHAMPNEAGVTFSHMHLSVKDIERHKKLWTNLFDGVVVEKAGYTAIRVPGALIFLREKEPTAPSEDTAMDHFGLKVRDLEAILTRWRTLGYDVERAASRATGAAQVYLTLPDGIRLALAEDATLSVAAEMSHVHFFASQPDELRAWYVDLFGAVPTSNNAREATAYIPGAALRFSHAEAARAPTANTAIDHIGFEVEDFDTFVDMLESKGISFVFGPRYIESLDLWVAFFPDPSGVVVEVSEGLDTF